jgi:hypothetical protein
VAPDADLVDRRLQLSLLFRLLTQLPRKQGGWSSELRVIHPGDCREVAACGVALLSERLWDALCDAVVLYLAIDGGP